MIVIFRRQAYILKCPWYGCDVQQNNRSPVANGGISGRQGYQLTTGQELTRGSCRRREGGDWPKNGKQNNSWLFSNKRNWRYWLFPNKLLCIAGNNYDGGKGWQLLHLWVQDAPKARVWRLSLVILHPKDSWCYPSGKTTYNILTML